MAVMKTYDDLTEPQQKWLKAADHTLSTYARNGRCSLCGEPVDDPAFCLTELAKAGFQHSLHGRCLTTFGVLRRIMDLYEIPS